MRGSQLRTISSNFIHQVLNKLFILTMDGSGGLKKGNWKHFIDAMGREIVMFHHSYHHKVGLNSGSDP